MPGHFLAEFIGAQEGEIQNPLHRGLGDFRQPSAGQMLPKEHTEHGRRSWILQRHIGNVGSGGPGIGGEQQPEISTLAAKGKNHLIPGVLMNLVHSGSGQLVREFPGQVGQIDGVKWHDDPPSDRKTAPATCPAAPEGTGRQTGPPGRWLWNTGHGWRFWGWFSRWHSCPGDRCSAPLP